MRRVPRRQAPLRSLPSVRSTTPHRSIALSDAPTPRSSPLPPRPPSRLIVRSLHTPQITSLIPTNLRSSLSVPYRLLPLRAPSFSFSTGAGGAAKPANASPQRSIQEAQAIWWRSVEHGSTDEMLEVIDEVGVDAVRGDWQRTALHIAASKGDKDMCALLIENDARIDIEDARGNTPVDYAVRCGNKEVAQLLLGWKMVLKGDEVVGRMLRRSYHVSPSSVHTTLLSSALPTTANATQVEFAGAVRNADLFLMQLLWFFSQFPISLEVPVGTLPLLYVAIAGKNLKVLQFLIDMGADVNALSADRISAVEVAVETGNEQALYILHNAGANTGLAPALLRAAASSVPHSAPMITKLIKMGAPPSSAAPDGAIGLHMAALTGNAAATEALLHGGARVNTLARQGATALFLAAMNGQVSVMRLLLENGADASLRNEDKWSPLFVAAHEGHAVQQLLEFKADVNALGDVGGGVMASPLCASAMNGHAEVARLLLAAGADIDGQLTQGSLPALVAALSHPSVVLLLLSHNANPNLRFPAVLLGSDDPNLETSPLAWAARAGDAGLVRLLLQHGADPKMMESNGATPLQLAEQGGHAEVMLLLRHATAK